jgi:hypothetical protein
VPSKHYPNRYYHIFIFTASINIQTGKSEKDEYLLNLSSFSARLYQWSTPYIQALLCRKFRMNTASRNIYFEFFNISGFGSRTRVLRNTWPIRSSFSRNDVKLARIGALWPVEPFLAFPESRHANVALSWHFSVVLPVGIIANLEEKCKFGTKMHTLKIEAWK